MTEHGDLPRHRPATREGAPTPPRGGDHAVLLPGWGTHPSRLAPLEETLRGHGVDAHTLRYDASGTLSDAARPLLAAIARNAAPRLHLVGHSLGGLLVAVAALADPGRIASVTTINTPWRGTWVAWTGRGRLATALTWGSEDLLALREQLAAHAADTDGPDWLLLAALGDLATPATTALRAGATGSRIQRRVIAAAGHSGSLASPRVQTAVARHVTGGRLDATT